MSGRKRRFKWFGRTVVSLLVLYLALGYTLPRVRWIRSQSSSAITGVTVALSRRPAGRVAGAIHVHTERSHDALGTEAEVAQAAASAGLDFVVVTDHRSKQSSDSLWQVQAREIEGVLIVRGQEVSLGSDVGRLLVFGLDTALTEWEGPPEAFGRLLERNGATGIVAHSRSPRTRDSWRPEGAPRISGWEVFDLADIGRTRLADAWVLYHLLALFASAPFDGSHRSLLRLNREGFSQPAVAAFDSMYARQRLTAVGGLDAHPKTRLLGHLLPAYEPFFRSVVNHVELSEPLPADPLAAADELGAGLRSGRVFISFGNAERAGDFIFGVAAGEVGWIADRSEVEWQPGLGLAAGFANGSEKRLLYRVVRDGNPEAWVRGPEMRWLVPQPGTYRVEVYQYTARVGSLYWNLRPWIFTNPRRVTAQNS